MATKLPYIAQIQAESHQQQPTRAALYHDLKKVLGMPVITFYTSFGPYVAPGIDNSDADTIESVLNTVDLRNGFALMINSPGGDGLAAERIINICRSYKPARKQFITIVPSKAKSAATMVCLGSDRILMRRTSELGPIDPQIMRVEGGSIKRFSLHNLVKSYDELFKRAEETKGKIDPYLLQLSKYDEREIADYRRVIEFSEDIALIALANGMMKGKKKSDIKNKIKMFLTPEETKVHGRPIYSASAKRCGLKVDLLPTNSKLSNLVYQLHSRLNNFTSVHTVKCIESETSSSMVSIGKEKS